MKVKSHVSVKLLYVSADVPRGGFHYQIRHPRGRSLVHRWSLVVQDKHLVLTDFRHKVEVLLQTHRPERDVKHASS